MPNEKKGITVKVDAELHAQVRAYIEAHGMTMAEFVEQALDNELHPKIQEGQGMNNTRPMAFQVPEEFFQQIKDYLNRHHLTQRDFVIGLIKAELDRDQQEMAEETEYEDDFVEDEETEDSEYEGESEDEEYDADEDFEEADESEDMYMG